MGNRAEPFLCQCHCLLERDVAGDSQYRIIRSIKSEKECFHLLQRCIGDMRQFLTDGRPLVRVRPVSQWPQEMPYISIRLIQATLLKLFHYHSPLHFQTPFTEIEAQHTV